MWGNSGFVLVLSAASEILGILGIILGILLGILGSVLGILLEILGIHLGILLGILGIFLGIILEILGILGSTPGSSFQGFGGAGATPGKGKTGNV